MSTLYASFATPADAERAAGAMLDHGAVADDLSLLANEKTATGQPVPQTSEVMDAEHSAKSGISTTTPSDVAAGTVKGATIGLGIGTLAALASLFIPGIGLVLGGGALASAFMAGAGTMIAGAAAGGVAGYLGDQGVPEDIVTRYSAAFQEGGAILAIAIPSGKLESSDAEALLVKYGASNIATVNASRPMTEGGTVPSPDPLVIEDENPAISPVMFAATPQPVVVQHVPSPSAFPVAAAITTDPLVAAADPLAVLVPENSVIVSPVAPGTRIVDVEAPVAEPLVDVIDTVSGRVVRRPVETIIPGGENAQLTTLTPNAEVVQEVASGQLHQTVGNPVTISETSVVVTDPVTGLKRPAKIVEEQHAVVRDSVAVDSEGHVSMAADGPEETVIVREKHIEL
jgi:hypothetical protein